MAEVLGGYRAAVADYLCTESGASTPPIVAHRLLRLDPHALGMGEHPTSMQLHATRIFLEDVAAGPREKRTQFRGDSHQLRNGAA